MENRFIIVVKGSAGEGWDAIVSRGLHSFATHIKTGQGDSVWLIEAHVNRLADWFCADVGQSQAGSLLFYNPAHPKSQ